MNSEANPCPTLLRGGAEMNDAAMLPHPTSNSEQASDYQISVAASNVERTAQETIEQRPCLADRIADALAGLRRR